MNRKSLPPHPRITILLTEDHAVVREGLRALLESENDMAVVGEAGNGREAIALARTLAPQIVLLDLAMPLLNGLDAMSELRTVSATSRVIILSAHNDEAYKVRARELGAAGYLTKQTAAKVLIGTIRQVARGKASSTLSSPNRTRPQAAEPSGNSGQATDPPSCVLTQRETEVLRLVAEGKANKETAVVLQLSVKTVEKHRQSLMQKLHIHDTAGLTRHAITVGLITCNPAALVYPSPLGRQPDRPTRA